MGNVRLWTIIVSVVCGSGPLARGADWSQFRGPSGDGHVEQQLPSLWSLADNTRWRTEVPGEGWSSPVVVAGRIYLTAAIPVSNSPAATLATQPEATTGEADGASAAKDFDLYLLAFDGATGQALWRTALFVEQSATAPQIHQKNSHASPTPFFDGQHLFVHFGHQGTACVTLDGQIVWRNASLAYEPVHGNGGSPVVVGQLVIFSRDGKEISEITALDKTTGQIAWQTPRDVEVSRRFSFCTPLVLELDGQTQLILPGSDVVQSLDPQTGQELWRVRYHGYSVIPKPIYHDGVVLISTSYDRPTLLAIDPTGRGDVTDTHVRWQTASAAIPHTPSLVARQGVVAMISDKGIASAYDVSNGQELWKERIGGNYSASPLLSDSHMHLLSEEGDYTVLDISGSPREVHRTKLGERTLASPAVIDNDLVIRTAQALYRIGR